MRIPVRHRFTTSAAPADLLRRLPPAHRFWLGASLESPAWIGAKPVRVVRGSPSAGLPVDEIREALPRVPEQENLGFCGGALGFVDFERGRFLEGIDGVLEGEAWFGIYDTVARFEPELREVEIFSWGLTEEGHFDNRLAMRRATELEERLRASRDFDPLPPFQATELSLSLSQDQHQDRVDEILRAISRGDIYQANLTARVEARGQGDPLTLFETLLKANAAPYSAFLETDCGTVVSSSPERLLRVAGRRLETRPIKGTAARASSASEDRRLGQALLASKKDRAELLMITDLLRNDLGKVAEFGSVRVPRLLELESFAHVHHLVSTVRATLAPQHDVFDALTAVFPGGSIVGTPKRRALSVLAELETAPRGVYTGAIGWIGFDRNADFSVAIRSGMLRGNTFSFGAGGGIVADSRPESEWRELLLKTKGLAFALGLQETVAEGAS